MEQLDEGIKLEQNEEIEIIKPTSEVCPGVSIWMSGKTKYILEFLESQAAALNSANIELLELEDDECEDSTSKSSKSSKSKSKSCKSKSKKSSTTKKSKKDDEEEEAEEEQGKEILNEKETEIKVLNEKETEIRPPIKEEEVPVVKEVVPSSIDDCTLDAFEATLDDDQCMFHSLVADWGAEVIGYESKEGVLELYTGKVHGTTSDTKVVNEVKEDQGTKDQLDLKNARESFEKAESELLSISKSSNLRGTEINQKVNEEIKQIENVKNEIETEEKEATCKSTLSGPYTAIVVSECTGNEK